MGSLPSIRTLTVSKEALKKLSNAAIDFDVRPHELVDAIVLLTDWEPHTGKLVEFVRKNREKKAASVPPSIPGPDPGSAPSLADARVLSESHRVSPESSPSLREVQKLVKKARENAGRVAPESDGSSEALKP